MQFKDNYAVQSSLSPHHKFPFVLWNGDSPVCGFSDKNTGEEILRLIRENNPEPWYVIQQDPRKAGPPFFVMDSGTASVMNPDYFCKTRNELDANAIVKALNGGYQKASATEPQTCTSEKVMDYRLHYVQKFTKEFVGNVLTFLDAAFNYEDKDQKTALKRLTKKEARKLLSQQWDVFTDSDYARQGESDDEVEISLEDL